MKFATGAEKAAYYREKKKNEVKASKLKYYNENADKINRKRSRPLEPSVISNAAIRQQKSRKNKAVIQGLYFDMKKQLSTDVRRTYKLNKKKKASVHSAAVVFLLAHSQNSDILHMSEHDHLDIVHTAMALLQ